MENLAVYLIKVNLVLSILFLFYFLLLRNEKFFRLNRIFFLSAIVLSFILPLLPAIHGFRFEKLQDQVSAINPFSGIYSGHSPENKLSLTPPDADDGHASRPFLFSGISAGQLLTGLYLVIAFVFLLQFAGRLIRLFYLFRGEKERLSGGIFCIQHDKEIPPFSFFHFLVINRSLFDKAQWIQIVEHEKVHIREWHSLDILLAELVNVLLWINPVARALKRSIRLNLEYLADEGVLKTGIDRKVYQMNLLLCLKPSAPSIANLFNSSKLKKRITMMNTVKTPLHHLYKYAFILPALFVSYFFVYPFQGRASAVKAFEHPAALRSNVPDDVIGNGPDNQIQAMDTAIPPKDLKAFEGYYTFQFTKGKDAYIKISAEETGLVLKQMWDGKEIHFKAKSPLEFQDDQDGKFPLKFIKDNNGVIHQVLALNRDLWTRAVKYEPMELKTVNLSPAQLEACAGKYSLHEDGKVAYIQIRRIENNLILKQMWDGKEFRFLPESELDFYCKEAMFPLKFTKDKNGTATQVLCYGRDLWSRVKE